MREKFKQVQLSIVPPLIIFWKRVPEHSSQKDWSRKIGDDSFTIKQKDRLLKAWQQVHNDAGQIHNKFMDNYGHAKLTSEINFKVRT